MAEIECLAGHGHPVAIQGHETSTVINKQYELHFNMPDQPMPSNFRKGSCEVQ